MPATTTYETDPANPDPDLGPGNNPAAPSDPDSTTGEAGNGENNAD